MSLSTQQIIDLSGAIVFSLGALAFGGLLAVQLFMARCPQSQEAPVRSKLLSYAGVISLIQAFAYWAAYGGYGSFVRAADSANVQFGLILTWPFSWYFVGLALGTYLWHLPYWRDQAGYSLALAGLAHYFGVYFATTTPGTQLIAYLIGLACTLCAVFIAFVLRRRRTTMSTVLLVVGVLAIVVGFYLPYLLGEFYMGSVTGTGISVWLLIANIVVYIVYFVVLYFYATDMRQKAAQ